MADNPTDGDDRRDDSTRQRESDTEEEAGEERLDAPAGEPNEAIRPTRPPADS